MDATEEAMLPHHVVKGRRTKRHRHLPTATASSSSSEEEDMANCLILLAQGPPPDAIIKETEKKTSRGVNTNGKAGFYLYECKTCNKCFPSFQALGGHRTSHKKPKPPIPPTQEKKTVEIEEDSIQLSMNSSSKSIIGKITRVHECLICGSEFSSGQALGGHMRRHRQTSLPPEPVEAKKKEKNNIMMSLDLNLPASDDDYSCSGGDELPAPPSAAATFSFANKTPLLLPTSALVDCLY